MGKHTACLPRPAQAHIHPSAFLFPGIPDPWDAPSQRRAGSSSDSGQGHTALCLAAAGHPSTDPVTVTKLWASATQGNSANSFVKRNICPGSLEVGQQTNRTQAPMLKNTKFSKAAEYSFLTFPKTPRSVQTPLLPLLLSPDAIPQSRLKCPLRDAGEKRTPQSSADGQRLCPAAAADPARWR